MENFVLPEGTDTLKESRELLNNALLTVRSLSSGTAFPTDNLSAGMLCYRTDLKRLYQYNEDGSWTADVAMSISGNADTANSAGTANTANKCNGNAATATALETPRSINGVSFNGTADINIDVGVKTINGTEPDANGDVLVASLPIGHIYQSFNPNIPVGSLPLFGGTYSREAYADLWEWVQSQTGYLITEAEWQTKATANAGNVPFYSDGDGSTTFRVPSLSCWVKGANGVEEVGSYLDAGLPNIEGAFGMRRVGTSATATDYNTVTAPSGAMAYTLKGGSTVNVGMLGVGSTNWNTDIVTLDASRSSSVYGNSDTVQPKSIVGMWLVKAFGTVSNVGDQDIADVSAGLTNVETRLSAEVAARNLKTYTNVSQIGLDSTCTEMDIKNALPENSMIVFVVGKTTYPNLVIWEQSSLSWARLVFWRQHANDFMGHCYPHTGTGIYVTGGNANTTSIVWDVGNATSIGGASALKPAVVVTTYRSGENWYRVYSDGWIEQGGYFGGSSSTTYNVTFLKAFKDKDYTLLTGSHRNGTETSGSFHYVSTWSATGFRHSTDSNQYVWWSASGQGA